MINMISSVSWVPKGASKAMPDSAEPLSKEEIKEFLLNKQKLKNSLSKKDNEEDDEEMEDEIQNGDEKIIACAKEVAKAFVNDSSKSNDASTSSSIDVADAVTKFLKEIDMDNYDKEDDEIELFSSGRGDLYYPSNDMDPYLKNTDVGDYDSEDIEDMTIRPTDSIIVCASRKHGFNYLEVHVYEESSNDTPNMYLRHDFIISGVPLCTAWLDCPLKGGEKGNFVATSYCDLPTIEIWDLDIVDQVLPIVQLGEKDGHTREVLDLAWNKEFRNILASASADKQVKVWDIVTETCNMTMEHHTDTVHAVAWNHFAPQVLLSGSFDKTVVLKDGRKPSDSGLTWSVLSEVEKLAWDPHSERSFVVSLNDGTVKGFDVRASDLNPTFTIHAHDDEVSTISYNMSTPNLLATGSKDKSVKLWDLSNNQPSCIVTHKPKIGEIFSVAFSADSPFLLAMGGNEAKLNVWDTLKETSVSRRYQP